MFCWNYLLCLRLISKLYLVIFWKKNLTFFYNDYQFACMISTCQKWGLNFLQKEILRKYYDNFTKRNTYYRNTVKYYRNTMKYYRNNITILQKEILIAEILRNITEMVWNITEILLQFHKKKYYEILMKYTPE